MATFIVKIEDEKLRKLAEGMFRPAEYINNWNHLLISKLDAEYDDSVEVMRID